MFEQWESYTSETATLSKGAEVPTSGRAKTLPAVVEAIDVMKLGQLPLPRTFHDLCELLLGEPHYGG